MTQPDTATERGANETGALELDTEGHSLLNAEYARTVERDRRRDTERNARDQAHVRELKKPSRSLRDRLFGR